MLLGKSESRGQIIDYLRESRDPVAVSELARLMDCSERTIHRYIDELRSRSVAIDSVLGPGGGLVLRPSRDLSVGSSEQTGSPQPERTGRVPFVGRSREIESLDQALDRAIAGNGGIVALVGEAGIGKTRIVEEFVTRATAIGVDSIWCTSQESQAAPAYWPWIQAIRKLIDSETTSVLEHIGENTARRVTDVAGATLTETDEAISGESDDDADQQFLLFDALNQFFKASARPRSLVIVLEDIHWSDRQSLQLLEFIGAQIDSSNMLIVITARDWQDGKSAGTLKELSRHLGFIRHDIDRFTHNETRKLVLAVGTEKRELIDEIFRLSEGNAFFAVELTRLVGPGKQRSSAFHGSFRLPETVTETITRRLEHLSASCTEILIAASVLGQQFGLEDLAGISHGQNTAEIGVYNEEAITADVVREHGLLNKSFEFSHALIQQAIYDAIPSIQRQLIHGSIAEHFESDAKAGRNSRSPRSPSEIAHHFIRSADQSKRGEIAHYSALAGDETVAGFAFTDAAGHYTTAIEYTDLEVPTSHLGDLYFKQGIALKEAGLGSEAIDSYTAAFNLFERIGDTARAITMSYQAIGRGPGVAAHQIELCERGLALVEEGSLDQARILNEMGAALGSNERQDEALDALEKSAAIATALEMPALAAHAMLNAAFTHLWSLDIHKSAEASTAALRLLESTEEMGLQSLGHRAATIAFTMLGEPEESRYHSDELIRGSLLPKRKGWQSAGFNENMACIFALREGRWNDAIAIGARNLADPIQTWDFSAGDIAELFTGDPFAALSNLLTTAGGQQLSADLDRDFRTELFTVVAEAGRVLNDPAAANAADEWASSILLDEDGPSLTTVTAAEVSKGLMAIASRNPDNSLPIYDSFKRFRGLWPWNFRSISPDRMLGLLAKSNGDTKLAQTHFEDALAFCEHANYGPELAWTCYDYASMLKDIGGITASRQAIGLTDRGLLETDRLGMAFLRAKLHAMKKDLTPYASNPYGLSVREIEILGHVSNGATNSEIASALFITENTVATHVASILTKTRTANRTEAAACAFENHIVPARSRPLD